ncbi:PREDICTED: transcription factor DIVARICATA-like [Tarenaya hassleriana]|uniref:transcription factor DIVARICATA-like n=1 Tax=Tarenaya hassleriana TaxID=28532 RepID=UPI00053C77E1|nr:PREDICTED: transcription factor DIVARICATA-like [Tarenaya hassleriana]
MNRGIDVLSPATYLQTSNWLFQESRGAKWTAEENKTFENALALYDNDTPDRWFKVAAMIPGKTVGDVIKQYRELEEDVSDIEAGLIPIPGYASDSFTLDWGGGFDDGSFFSGNNGGFDVNGYYFAGGKRVSGGRLPGNNSFNVNGYYYFAGGKRSSGGRTPEQERKKGVPWTEEEHRQFLMGLKKYGKGDWRNIARNFVKTRTPTQVASHAQKYFIRQLTGGKDKRRSSIHDITTDTVNVPDPNANAPLVAENADACAVFGQNAFLSDGFFGTPYVSKLQDHGVLNATQLGGYNAFLQM